MSELHAQPATRRDARKNGKRRPIIAFALATLAVGGVGAALTSAAWTDNVFFSAGADAASFDLQGSLDGQKWEQSNDGKSITLKVDATKFAKLIPNDKRSVTLYVKNFGNVSATLTSTVEWSADTSFTQKPTAVVTGLAEKLTPVSTAGDTDQFTLDVSTISDWLETNQGKSGTVIVTINGTATS